MRNRTLLWLLLGGGAFVLFAIVALSLLLALGGDSGEFSFGGRIQVVDIEGELVDSEQIIEQLKRYEDSRLAMAH